MRTFEIPDVVPLPLLKYHMLENASAPTIAVVAFHTSAGTSFFAVTREVLEQLAESFQTQAEKMPRKRDQN